MKGRCINMYWWTVETGNSSWISLSEIHDASKDIHFKKLTATVNSVNRLSGG